MPEKRRKSKNWRMSKKNKRLQAYRMKVPTVADATPVYKNHRARAVVIRSQMLNSAAGLSNYISQTSSQRGVAGGRYTSSHSILTVGDGNFSFSVALASALGGSNIVASSYDSKREVLEKYASALENMEALKKLGVAVYHSVDATRLSECLATKSEGSRMFDRVIFNFPHAESQDVKKQQRMLFAFFSECCQKDVLTAQGEVHVTLRTTTFYESWEIEIVAESAGLELVKKVPFDVSSFYGYSEVRTRGENVMRQAPSIESAVTYIFHVPANSERSQSTEDPGLKAAHEGSMDDTKAPEAFVGSENAAHTEKRKLATTSSTSTEVQHSNTAGGARKRTRKQRRKSREQLPAFQARPPRTTVAPSTNTTNSNRTENQEQPDEANAVDFFAEWVRATGGDVPKQQVRENARQEVSDDDSDDNEEEQQQAENSDDDDDDDDDFLAELIFARRNRAALTADSTDRNSAAAAARSK